MYLLQDEDDAALVNRALAGDVAAFEALVGRHQRALYTVACRMLGNREDAADALQSALIKTYEHLGQFDPRHRFFSWFYRIVVNECLNMLRARRPEDALTPALMAAGTPYDTAADAERARQVQTALMQLTTDARTVVVLRHYGELSYDEIAETLGVPAKTVKSRLHTARQKLGEHLLGLEGVVMTRQHGDLLHARLDGELTAGQRAEVDRLLASDDSARQRADQLEALGRSLDLLKPGDPPARVMHAVLAHVKRGASMADADAETATLGGVLMRTKVLWGLAAAAAIVLAFFSVTGFPPTLGGTEGAIGAAKRYQAGQIAASDVKLGDQSAQEFLQSDLFDKLMKDESVRKALTDPALVKAIADPSLKALLTNPAFGRALVDTGFAKALASPAFGKALVDADFRNAIADPAFGKALSDLELGKQLTDTGFAKALTDQALVKALTDSDLAKALTDSDFVKALTDPALAKALTDQALVKALSDPALGKALVSSDLQKALTSNGLGAALTSPQFGTAMRSALHE